MQNFFLLDYELTFRATYSIACSTVGDELSKRMFESVVESSFLKISEICATGRIGVRN